MGSEVAHLAYDLQGVSSSQACIDQTHVRIASAYQFKNLLGIGRVSDDVALLHLFQGRANTLTEQGLLINDENTYRFHITILMRCTAPDVKVCEGRKYRASFCLFF